jgi:hypothetical protein
MSILDSGGWLAGHKAGRLARTWAPVFRARCLPLIDETAFAGDYCADNGRPNVPVRVLVGLLILKEVWDLTDQEALEALDFDVRWQTALGVSMDDPAPCQKTVHAFRTRLVAHDAAGRLFATITDALLAALGLSVGRQRLDSTHIRSNLGQLTRLRLFCETLRTVLHALDQHAPAVLATVPAALRARYLPAEGADFGDARSTEAQRRVTVAARDAWRLQAHLSGRALPAAVGAAAALLSRLVAEQCEVVAPPAVPAPDDADADAPPAPVRLKPAAAIGGLTLQSPHDPDASYGRKGQGYEVAVVETAGNGDLPELITHLAVAPACAPDQDRVAPALDDLAARGVAPRTCTMDTTCGPTAVVLAARARGVEIVAPVAGYAPTPAPADAPLRVTAFHLPWTAADPPARCPLGVDATEVATYTAPRGGAWVALVFAASACAGCPQRARCPVVTQPDGTHVLRMEAGDAVTLARRDAQTRPDFREAYRWRAGIEATNSELKRAHGLGRLRVRGLPRVWLAVHFKGLACNCKRAVRYWMRAGAAPRAAWAAVAAQCGAQLARCVRQPLPAALRALPLLPASRYA